MPKPNLEPVFVKVANHLLKQNARSIGRAGGCAYRGENGCKCAVGCLFPDDRYHPSMEGVGIRSQIVGMVVAQELGFANRSSVLLLEELQSLHDYVPIENWGKALAEMAAFHKFTWSAA